MEKTGLWSGAEQGGKMKNRGHCHQTILINPFLSFDLMRFCHLIYTIMQYFLYIKQQKTMFYELIDDSSAA